MKLLEIKGLNSGYGKKVVVEDINMLIRSEEIVALIGPNGSGKSTILKAIFGVIKLFSGQVIFNGDSDISDWRPFQKQKAGIVYIPQGNRIFPDLTIKANLEVGLGAKKNKYDKKRLSQIEKEFPFLYNRQNERAGVLSGGERQMLALARGLILEPKVLLIDEPSIGLAPTTAKKVLKRIAEIKEERKIGILIVEQKVREVLNIADRVNCLKLGRIVLSALPKEITEQSLKEIFF